MLKLDAFSSLLRVRLSTRLLQTAPSSGLMVKRVHNIVFSGLVDRRANLNIVNHHARRMLRLKLA